MNVKYYLIYLDLHKISRKSTTIEIDYEGLGGVAQEAR